MNVSLIITVHEEDKNLYFGNHSTSQSVKIIGPIQRTSRINQTKKQGKLRQTMKNKTDTYND